MRRGAVAAVSVAAALALPATATALVTPASTAPARERLQLVLPLVADQGGLSRMATAVSTPSSPQYGRYRSLAWLARRFGAAPATRGRVVAYLRSHGASRVVADVSGQFVDAVMDVSAAQRVFGTSLSRARLQVGSGAGAHAATFTAPATAVVVPRALRGLVSGVIGLDTASIVRDRAAARAAAVAPGAPGATPPAGGAMPPAPGATPLSTLASSGSSGYQGPDQAATPTGCRAGIAAGGFTPNEYLDAYDYTPLQQQGLVGQGERVALVEIDGYRSRDLRSFAHCFHLSIPQIRTFGVSVGKPLPPGGETTIDLEVLDAAAPGLRTIDLYETQPDAATVLRTIMAPLENPGFKPQVISVSLGLCEADTVQGVGRAEIRALETAFKLATAEGVSVLGASGDFGSADCPKTDSSPPIPIPTLAVNFPSSSPWVTSVGGTNLSLDAQNQIVGETVWNDAGANPGNAGGGGVSELFSRPSWQDGVVAKPWRGQPDVAMLADVSPGYDVYCTASRDCQNVGWETFGGTSAATPLMAGGFALIDEFLRRNNRVALGLANPLLYRLGRNPTTAGQVYFDVTTGSNDVGPFLSGTTRQPLGCCTARPGYDEASGWGGVNLDAFAQAALTAQHELATVTMSIPGGQHAYPQQGVYARLSCSRACDTVAYARVTVPGARSFTAYSSLQHLIERNTRRVEVLFSPAQLVEIHTALKAHRSVTAQLVGAIVDSGGNLERRTPPAQVQITL